MVVGVTGSVESITSWYLVILGQFRVVLDGTWWYAVSMGLSHSILRRKMNDDINQWTDRATIVQSAFSKVGK